MPYYAADNMSPKFRLNNIHVFQRSMKNWNYDERTWDEEKLTVYNRRRRIIYGISLALNISAFSFYITELLSNPIEESYWNEMEKISDGGTCRDSCRASMAAVAFLMMSLSNWLNFINSIHENSFFGGEQAQNFKDARIQELEIFPIFTIASLLRIATTCGFWAYRVARVRSYSGECTESHLDFFGWFEFGIEYRKWFSTSFARHSPIASGPILYFRSELYSSTMRSTFAKVTSYDL